MQSCSFGNFTLTLLDSRIIPTWDHFYDPHETYAGFKLLIRKFSNPSFLRAADADRKYFMILSQLLKNIAAL